MFLVTVIPLQQPTFVLSYSIEKWLLTTFIESNQQWLVKAKKDVRLRNLLWLGCCRGRSYCTYSWYQKKYLRENAGAVEVFLSTQELIELQHLKHQ